MTVAVRMEAAQEQELERAARQLGVSKSQFTSDAVEHAPGRKDPFALLQRAHQKFGLRATSMTRQEARRRGETWQPDDRADSGASVAR